MWYEAEITIPAGTLKAAPTTVVLPISYGIVHHVIIEALAGCERYAAIRVLYHEHQVWPSNSDGDIALNVVPREFDDRLEVLTEPLTLKIIGYAPLAAYDHTYRVGIGILPPETFPEYRADSSILSKIGRLLGVIR